MSENKLDDLLNIGCNLDWITPLYVILRDAAHGSAAHFGVDATGGFDRGDIRRVLRTGGIESWGYVYNVAGDMIMLSVPKSQAAAANYWLQQSGVPVLYSPIGAATPADEAPRPSVALGNTFQTGGMRLVKAPSVWGLLKRLVR